MTAVSVSEKKALRMSTIDPNATVADTHIHVHLANNVLFSAVVTAEHALAVGAR